MAQKYLITTAIDYVNSRPHLGTAYEKIAADCIARAHRRLGRDVRFVIGNDEHSTNVAKSAREQGMDPLAYCDRMEGEFREAWKRLDISFDDFIRTTEPRHRQAVQELLRRIQANGHVRKDRYEGWYCEGCEAFYTEKDLVGGLCPNHETRPKWVKEENFFFRLSAFQQPLLEHIRANPDFIRPETRRNEIVAFLESGLTDISISRAGVEWGIPFPDDPGHVVYVWFDALINYIAAAGFGTDDAKFARWWPADLHVIGKDITRFHCVIWPAMLLAAGLELPGTVFGHGFITHAGRKMSKSLGNIVSPLDAVELAGADALRYFLLREVTFGKDGDFSWETFIGRNNADLANDLGNLVQRTTDMTTKFLGGRIPEGADAGTDRTGLRNDASDAVVAAVRAYERLDLSEALAATWVLIRRANQTVQETRPWEIAKDEARRAELGGVLADLLEAIRVAAVLVEPAMPTGARAILERLGLDPDPGPWAESTVWRERAAWAVGSGAPLFPRRDAPAPEAAPPAPAKSGAAGKKAKSKKAAAPPEAIEFADFQNVELLVATVKSAEPVEGADRLLRLQLDDGRGGRQVVAGIAGHFRPEDLPGRQIVLVANLKPAKIRGVESQGMILAARSGDEFVLLGPQGSIAPGARIS